MTDEGRAMRALLRTVPCVLAVAVVGTFASPAMISVATAASQGSTTLQQFGARVSFPLYQATAPPGFKLTLDGPLPCGSEGIETITAIYKKGAGKQAPVIGFDESYPKVCGNAGESMTVTTVDIDGVKVPVAVDLYCDTFPKCNVTVNDGFTHGFLLYLREPGPKRTMLEISSRYVSLDVLLNAVRSLNRVVPARPTVSGGAFRSPSGNLSCDMGDTLLYCQSLKLPHGVRMGLDGQFISGPCSPTSCIGKPATSLPTLAYGQQVTVGGFRCVSQQGRAHLHGDPIREGLSDRPDRGHEGRVMRVSRLPLSVAIGALALIATAGPLVASGR